MSQHNLIALIKNRLDQADQSLEAARTLLDQKLYRDSINRSYYAMFYIVLALLVTKKMGTSKHSGAISLFDREFIKPGIFPKDLSQWIHKVFEKRLESDYGEMVEISQDDAGQALTRAREFFAQIKPYLSDMVENSHLS